MATCFANRCQNCVDSGESIHCVWPKVDIGDAFIAWSYYEKSFGECTTLKKLCSLRILRERL